MNAKIQSMLQQAVQAFQGGNFDGLYYFELEY
jgi:hypothetical protein